MKIPYVRRKQPRLAGMGDGKWHRVMGEPEIPRPWGEQSTDVQNKHFEELRFWRNWLCHPQTFCGQAYIEKYWLTQPDHDHFREVCEDCEAEVAARVLIGKLVID